ncbi:hypothetical protein WKK05_34885 [Nostoc sp. UHCC 0302]|uniref:hypothetical protein n=1 Tax=Nostoc sp. UHCC 0302 TaxID=3134896 RepID=UPI00311C8B6D
MASDCPEKLTWEFLKFIWTYPITRRPVILEKLSKLAPNQQIIILKKPQEIRSFLQNIY